MPAARPYLPAESYRRVDELEFGQRAERDIWALGFSRQAEEDIASLATLAEPPQITRQADMLAMPDPLPVVVSERPSAAAVRDRQEAAQPAAATVQPAAMPSATRTLPSTGEAIGDVEITAGASPAGLNLSQGRDPERQQQAYQQARASGLDDEGARVLVAVLETEGGTRGAIGDQGQAHGGYQFHERGELPGFAAWLGTTVDDARRRAQDVGLATRYAAEGYLGQAIEAGRKLGLAGAELATYVQQHGQRSVSPETTGANYTRLFGSGATPAPMPEGGARRTPVPAEETAGAQSQAPTWGTYTAETLTPNQFTEGQQQGLTTEEAVAVCGPAAAVAFARANGRNPTLREAKELAQGLGLWNVDVGMQGPASQVRLLERMGVKANLRAGTDWGAVAREVQGGRPVIVDTPQHYYVVTAYHPETGEFEFGASAGVLRASRGKTRWRPEELPSLGMGAPRATIFLNGAEGAR